MMSGNSYTFTRAPAGRALWHDAVFWWALLLGMTGCWLVAWLLDGASGTELLEQWRRLVWLVLLFPVMEEWLFRGVLQPALLKAKTTQRCWYGVTLANVGTTSIFSALHLVAHPPLWASLVVLPSLIFGWFRDRHNSILPAVVLHAGYNLAYFTAFGLPG